MCFICILLVYFWKNTLCTSFCLQTCLYYSFPQLMGWGGCRPQIWSSLDSWHISHLLSEQFTLRDSPSVSPAPLMNTLPFPIFLISFLISSTLSSLTFSSASHSPLFLLCAVWLAGQVGKLWLFFSHNSPCHSLFTASLTFCCILVVCVLLLQSYRATNIKCVAIECYHLREGLRVSSVTPAVPAAVRRGYPFRWLLKLVGSLMADGHCRWMSPRGDILNSFTSEISKWCHQRNSWQTFRAIWSWLL